MTKRQAPQPLTQTGVRKLPVGTTVALVSAPHVRFKRVESLLWDEVPRMGVVPRTKSSAELFLLGVNVV